MEIFLETERLVLRAFTAADAENLHELNADPDVTWYVTGGEPTPRDVVETQLIPRFLGFHERSDWQGYWAAETKRDREFLGWFHVLPEADGVVDLGYRLRKAAWNRGYATEASRAIIDHCFAERRVRRITAHALAVNVPSRRVMEKCGMTRTGTYQPGSLPDIPGADQGAVAYALTRDQWASRALRPAGVMLGAARKPDRANKNMPGNLTSCR
jgi:RimJ/RimL family protein N-acetyltransferase